MDVSNDIAGLYNLEQMTTDTEFYLYALKNGSDRYITASVVTGTVKDPFIFCLDNIIRKAISAHYTQHNLPNYDQRHLDNFDKVKKLFLLKEIKVIE